MKRFFAMLLCTALCLGLMACGQKEPAAAALTQITVGTTSAIESATRGEYAYDMLASGVSEPPLVYQDDQGNYHPLVASFETEDAATWTFTVQDGMTWSDGQPVTAEDILFTLEYEQSQGSAHFTPQTGEDGKEVPAKYAGYTLSDDGRSISLTLAEPNIRELGNMTTFRVMPKHIYQGRDSVTEEEARVGCGPYVLSSFDRDAGTLTFVRNSYYPQKPNVNTVVYQLFGSEDTMYMALRQGDIDLVWNYSMGVSGTYLDVLAGDENVTLASVAAANAPAVLAFNNANGLFADENLRQAVSYALDYDAFQQYFGSSAAQNPARGFVPPVTMGYTVTEPLTHDTDKAAGYMAAAGYTEKNADGFYVNADGETAAFTLTVNAAKEAHVGYAELVKTQLEQFGIRVDLDAVDKDAYNAKTSNKFSQNHITMEAAIYGFTAAGMGMGSGLGSIYVDGNHAVQGGCQVFDTELDDLLERMKTAGTVEDYTAAAGELQAYYAQHIPMIALYWDSMTLAYSAGLHHVTVDAVFGLNNVNNWFTMD